jgi:hypothetical protein
LHFARERVWPSVVPQPQPLLTDARGSLPHPVSPNLNHACSPGAQMQRKRRCCATATLPGVSGNQILTFQTCRPASPVDDSLNRYLLIGSIRSTCDTLNLFGGLSQLLRRGAYHIYRGPHISDLRGRVHPKFCRRSAELNFPRNGPAVPVTHAIPFQCPTCCAEYKLVRFESKEAVPDQQITCRKCRGPLPGSEGHLILRYFLVDRGRRRASGARQS